MTILRKFYELPQNRKITSFELFKLMTKKKKSFCYYDSFIFLFIIFKFKSFCSKI